jgi:hypothetical protein
MPRQKPFRHLRPGVSQVLAPRPATEARHRGWDEASLATAARIGAEDADRPTDGAGSREPRHDAFPERLAPAARDIRDLLLLRFDLEIVLSPRTGGLGRGPSAAPKPGPDQDVSTSRWVQAARDIRDLLLLRLALAIVITPRWRRAQGKTPTPPGLAPRG